MGTTGIHRILGHDLGQYFTNGYLAAERVQTYRESKHPPPETKCNTFCMCNYLTAHRHDDTNKTKNKTKNDGLQNENVLHTGPKIVHNI